MLYVIMLISQEADAHMYIYADMHANIRIINEYYSYYIPCIHNLLLYAIVYNSRLAFTQ
jgi:hypothetical protein